MKKCHLISRYLFDIIEKAWIYTGIHPLSIPVIWSHHRQSILSQQPAKTFHLLALQYHLLIWTMINLFKHDWKQTKQSPVCVSAPNNISNKHCYQQHQYQQQCYPKHCQQQLHNPSEHISSPPFQESSRGHFLSPLTPTYMPFGIRRFSITSKHGVLCSNRNNSQVLPASAFLLRFP